MFESETILNKIITKVQKKIKAKECYKNVTDMPYPCQSVLTHKENGNTLPFNHHSIIYNGRLCKLSQILMFHKMVMPLYLLFM